MTYAEDSPFYRLLATEYDPSREDEAIAILEAHPEQAKLEWPGPDEQGQPFVKGSTALHYAANDGKLRLMTRLIVLGTERYHWALLAFTSVATMRAPSRVAAW